jgi:iron complex transport system ATP-binding protein
MSAVLAARINAVRLQGRAVLDALELALQSGRWYAVVGPNGAGKSTLLRALAGLLPIEGEVRLRGRPLRDWPAKARARELAWLGQDEHGSDALRAGDVVMLGRLPHQAWLAAPGAADHATVERAMRATQSLAWRERVLARLSGGERQRVLLARLLATEAPLMLMDEPLAHLDPPHQADWQALVREQCAQGRTVVSVLHELNMALGADELLVMHEGRLVHQGAPADPATHAALMQVFGGRLRFAELEGRWLALPT